MEAVEENLIERAWGNLARGFRDIATGAARTLGLSQTGLQMEPNGLKTAMRSCIVARGGDVAARLRAAELGEAYSKADREQRKLFLKILAEDFATDPTAVSAAVAAWQDAAPEDRPTAEEQLRQALQAPRVKLLTQFLSLPAGVKFLVDLRSDLMAIAGEDKALRRLDHELRGLLESWFDVGFLDVRLITWDSPASLLEKIIDYEAVHEIRSWSDLRNRLESDRRLYGLFHLRMPDEPLAFVEVALTERLADSVQELLDEQAPAGDLEAVDTAIFYSISATQAGLSGIAFGEWLIKRVVQRLQGEMPRLKTFATLSPVPGFAKWLDGQKGALLIRLTPEGERNRLKAAVGKGDDFPQALHAALERQDWANDEGLVEALQPILRRLALRYLLERRDDGQSIDPVARFHLRNGARLERINWMADRSANGLAIAYGIMVNYLYDPAYIDANHEAYGRSGKVALSSEMRSLSRQVSGQHLPALGGPEPAPASAPKAKSKAKG